MSRRRIIALAGAALSPAASTGPALAHPGAHHGMSLAELVQHLASGWHLLTLAAALMIGAAAIMIAGHRRQARAQFGERRQGGRT